MTKPRLTYVDKSQPPGAVPAKAPKYGGRTIAPPTDNSPAVEPPAKLAHSVLNLRLTQEQELGLKTIRDRTGLTLQAQVRRAVTDYINLVRSKRPDLFQ